MSDACPSSFRYSNQHWPVQCQGTFGHKGAHHARLIDKSYITWTRGGGSKAKPTEVRTAEKG